MMSEHHRRDLVFFPRGHRRDLVMWVQTANRGRGDERLAFVVCRVLHISAFSCGLFCFVFYNHLWAFLFVFLQPFMSFWLGIHLINF